MPFWAFVASFRVKCTYVFYVTLLLLLLFMVMFVFIVPLC